MQMVGAFAEFERAMLKERTKAGLDAARKEGRIGGRPPKLKPHQQQEIVTLVKQGKKTAADAARLFGVHPATVSRLLRRTQIESSTVLSVPLLPKPQDRPALVAGRWFPAADPERRPGGGGDSGRLRGEAAGVDEPVSGPDPHERWPSLVNGTRRYRTLGLRFSTRRRADRAAGGAPTLNDLPFTTQRSGTRRTSAVEGRVSAAPDRRPAAAPGPRLRPPGRAR